MNKKTLATKLAAINAIGADRGNGPELPQPQPTVAAFARYQATLKELLVACLGSDIELTYFEWDASAQNFTIQVEHWNRALPTSLPLAARYNTSWAPPLNGVGTKVGILGEGWLVGFFNEIASWRAKVERMFRAARAVENSPDLGPLPEHR